MIKATTCSLQMSIVHLYRRYRILTAKFAFQFGPPGGIRTTDDPSWLN